MDEEIVNQYWQDLLKQSSDEKTIDFKDICIWILTRPM